MRLLFAILLALLAADAHAASVTERHRYEFWAERVIDGDTVEGRICATVDVHLPNQPMRVPFCISEAVRIEGVDTPELHGKCDAERDAAKRAREFVFLRLEMRAGERIPGRENYVVVSRLARLVTRAGAERDKYGRILGDLEIEPGAVSLRQDLIDSGLARRYDGGARQGWCP